MLGIILASAFDTLAAFVQAYSRYLSRLSTIIPRYFIASDDFISVDPSFIFKDCTFLIPLMSTNSVLCQVQVHALQPFLKGSNSFIRIYLNFLHMFCCD